MTDEAVPEIDIATLADQLGSGVPVFDVRQPDEYISGHLPGAVLIPLGEVPDRVSELPVDRAVYIVCQVGGRSHRAAELLRAKGIDAVNVAGGTAAWIAADLPVVTGDQPG